MIIYKDKRYYPAMPSAARTRNGTIIIVFRNAPREKKGFIHLHSLSSVFLTASSDNGKTWRKPIELAGEDPLAKQDPHLFITDSGKVLLYYFRYLFHPESELSDVEKQKDLTYIHSKKKKTIATLRGLGMMTSSDNGLTFSEPLPVTLPGTKSCAVRGRAIQLPGGRILQAIYARKYKGKYYIDLIASDDDGITWQILCRDIVFTRKKNGTIYEYVEPSLLHTTDGTIYLFIRTHENNTRGFTTYCRSDDGGRSFSRVEETGVEGFPLDPLVLRDGRVMLSYGWRGGKPYGVRYRIIKPDLSDLSDTEEVTTGLTSTTPDCGYPWTVEIDDNRILVVSYATDPDGCTKICGDFIEI
jgi:sialidase-1